MSRLQIGLKRDRKQQADMNEANLNHMSTISLLNTMFINNFGYLKIKIHLTEVLFMVFLIGQFNVLHKIKKPLWQVVYKIRSVVGFLFPKL